MVTDVLGQDPIIIDADDLLKHPGEWTVHGMRSDTLQWRIYVTAVSQTIRSVNQLALDITFLGFFTNCTKMPILAFSSLMHENKKIQLQKMLPLVGIESGPLLNL